jgi:hypothetical protein
MIVVFIGIYHCLIVSGDIGPIYVDELITVWSLMLVKQTHEMTYVRVSETPVDG